MDKCSSEVNFDRLAFNGSSGFDFAVQVFLKRFYALLPAGLSADRLRSNRRLESEARQE